MIPSISPVIAGKVYQGDEFTWNLYHFEGADGSTVYRDSARGRTSLIPRGQIPVIRTDRSKFGKSCVQTAGVGALRWETVPDLSGSWAFDCWFQVSSTAQNRNLFRGLGSSAFLAHYNAFGGGQRFAYYLSSNGSNWNILQQSYGSNTFPINTWTHFAMTFDGNFYRWFINGNLDKTHQTTIKMNGVSDFNIGGINGEYWNGYVDEARVSIGTPRWTSSFTPPSEPYS